MFVRTNYELVVDLRMSMLEVIAHLAVQEVVLSPLAPLKECVEASEFRLVVFCSGVDSPAYLLLGGSSIEEYVIHNVLGTLVADGAIYW